MMKDSEFVVVKDPILPILLDPGFKSPSPTAMRGDVKVPSKGFTLNSLLRREESILIWPFEVTAI